MASDPAHSFRPVNARRASAQALLPRPAGLVVGADVAATVLFALEGAIASIAVRLDLFGVLTVAFATALGGGITRDAVVGATPVRALRFKRYPVAAFAAGLAVFVFASEAREIPEWLIVTLDAAGLGLFAVAGAKVGLDRDLNGVSATMLGVLTAIGGGVIQALLLGEVPPVLREHIYASAALVGAALTVFGIRRGGDPARLMALGALACFALRMLAYWQDWNLPTIGG